MDNREGQEGEERTSSGSTEQAGDYYNDLAIAAGALYDQVEAGSQGALEALKHVAEVAVDAAVKWTLGRG